MALLRKSSQAANQAEHANPLYRYTPASLSVHSKRRFSLRRKAEYLAQISGSPTPWQITAIESLIRREWLTMLAERSDDVDGALRCDREWQKLAADFRRSLPVPAAAPQPTLADALAAIAARRRAQPEPEDNAA